MVNKIASCRVTENDVVNTEMISYNHEQLKDLHKQYKTYVQEVLRSKSNPEKKEKSK